VSETNTSTEPVDTTKPVVAVTLDGGDDGKELTASSRDVTVVFTFDQPVTGLSIGDLDVTGGEILGFEPDVNDNQVWRAEFRAYESDLLSATVTIKAGVVTDQAGNANDEPAGVQFWGDTKEGVQIPTLTLRTDTGTADGVTSDPMVTGTGTAGSTISLYAQTGSGEPVLLSDAIVVQGDGTWSYNLTSSDKVLQGTAYTLTATAAQGDDTSGTS
jgi:hypothetical protein